MNEYNRGTLYFVAPGWDGEDEGLGDWRERQATSLEKAQELWEIAGRPDKTAQIERVLDRANGRYPVVFDDTDLADLVVALDGLREALVGPVLDEQLRMPRDRIAELRAKYLAIDLRENTIYDVELAVGEAMNAVLELREHLCEARARGCHVFLSH